MSTLYKLGQSKPEPAEALMISQCTIIAEAQSTLEKKQKI
jgi:hypothetical protein